jgi:SAM-dependent methyltransferase
MSCSTSDSSQNLNLDLFVCPSCAEGKLTAITENTEIKMKCNYCQKFYPILKGIPRFVDSDNYSNSFGYQWNIHCKTQLDSNTHLPISEYRVKVAIGQDLLSFPNQTILEAGSGSGRFTEVLIKSGAKVFSFDYSTAVDANAKNNQTANNLSLFQGNIFQLPFLDNTFDHVFCLGVLQHTPDPQKAFFSLAKKVKPGGFLYIDVYTKSWHHHFQWKYFLRPLTKRMNQELLYKIISKITPPLIPFVKFFKNFFGKIGNRILPIVEYSQLGLSKKLNEEWAILDTFDMYSPAHDHPKSLKEVQDWFSSIGFENVEVFYGDNGVVGRGRKPTVAR